jgi:hypothetical protein
MKHLEDIASSFFQALSVKTNFQDSVLKSFMKGSDILEKYSFEELNKKFITSESFQELPSSHLIKKDTFYFVTENTLEKYPSKDSHAGLYRFNTHLDFQTKLIEDGFDITACYKTQRDHSSSVHTGTEFRVKYRNGKFYGFSSDSKILDSEMGDFQILKVKYNIFCLNDKNEICATFKQDGEIIKGTDSALNLKEFIAYVCDNIKKSKYLIGINWRNNFTIEYPSKKMNIQNIDELILNEDVEDLKMTSCNHEKVSIPIGVKKLEIQTPKNFKLKFIPKDIEKLTFWEKVDLSKFKIKNFPNLSYLRIYDCGKIKLEIEENIKNLSIYNTNTIITKLPEKHFNFSWDSKVWFGYSKLFLNSTGVENHENYGLRIKNVSTKNGQTFLYTDAWGHQQTISLKELQQNWKFTAPKIVEWATNLNNPQYYVDKLKQQIIERVNHRYICDSIEPRTYHTSSNFTDLNINDIIECTYKGSVSKYVVNSVHLRNSTFGLIPFEKRFDHSSSDFIQVTSTSRVEGLMIDLYPINRVPYRGWKNRELVINKIDGILNINEAIQHINTDNIHSLLDQRSLEIFKSTM